MLILRRKVILSLTIIWWAFYLSCYPSFIQAEDLSQQRGKVGMILPLSGNYSAIGADTREGFEAAIELSKSKNKSDYFFVDSKGDPVTAVTEFKRLVLSEKVSAVYAIRGPVGMALNPLSLHAKTPLLGGIGNDKFTASNQYAFQIWSSAKEEGAFIAKNMKSQNFRKYALITAEDDWTISVSDAVRSELNGEARVLIDQEVLPSEVDFRSLLLQLKESKVEVAFINLTPGQIAAFVKQARSLRIYTPFYSNFWISKKEVIEAVGAKNIEGIKYVEMDTELPIFKGWLSKHFGTTPTSATLSAYLATLLIEQCRKIAPSSSSEDLYTALSSQHELFTLDRSYKIINHGVKVPLIVRELHNIE